MILDEAEGLCSHEGVILSREVVDSVDHVQDWLTTAGAKLPPSVAERNISQANGKGDPKQTVISGFLQPKTTFVNRVLNQLIMVWQIRQALPWSWIEDQWSFMKRSYHVPRPQLPI